MGFLSSSSSTCGPQLVHGEMFFFGSLAFLADDSLGWQIRRSRRSCCLPEATCTLGLMNQGPFASIYRLVLVSKLCCLLAARRRDRAALALPIETSLS